MISLDPKRALVMPAQILPIMALGLPNAASTILSGFASTFSNNLLSRHGTDAIAAMGEQYMLYVMAGAPFLGLVYISTNYLQATKKAAPAIVVSLLRQGLLLIPLLYILHAVAGFYGLAAAHMAADMIAALVATIIFVYQYCRMEDEKL